MNLLTWNSLYDITYVIWDILNRFLHDEDMELIRIHLTVISDYIYDLGHFKTLSRTLKGLTVAEVHRVRSFYSAQRSMYLEF